MIQQRHLFERSYAHVDELGKELVYTPDAQKVWQGGWGIGKGPPGAGPGRSLASNMSSQPSS